jgi:hypothetical protein
MNRTVAQIPWIKDVKLQPSSEDLISVHYPSGAPVGELLNSIVPKPQRTETIGMKLEAVPELSPEDVVEMAEEEAVSYEELRSVTEKANSFDDAIAEAKREVAEALHVKHTAQLTRALATAAPSSTDSASTSKDLKLKEIPLTDVDLKFAVSTSHPSLLHTHSHFPPAHQTPDPTHGPPHLRPGPPRHPHLLPPLHPAAHRVQTQAQEDF